MKNYIEAGKTIVYSNAGSNITSGSVVVLGNRIAVANVDIPTNSVGTLSLVGCFSLPAVTNAAFAQGDPLYWDAGSHVLTLTSSGNTPAGIAFRTKITAAALAVVRLENPSIGGGGGSGANTTLSNLDSPTALNQDLVFDSTITLRACKTADAVDSADSSPIIFGSGQVDDGESGAVTVQSGPANGIGDSGALSLLTGDAGASTSGVINIKTGAGDSFSGDANFGTGNSNSHNSGSVQIYTGNAADDSGNIQLITGSGTNRGYIDLQSLFVNLPTGTSDPASPFEGSCYWDTTSHVMKVYDGTAWKTVTVS